MKRLINQLFSKEEIMEGQHEQVNDRTKKIKGKTSGDIVEPFSNLLILF
jgi:hypothetical protein